MTRGATAPTIGHSATHPLDNLRVRCSDIGLLAGIGPDVVQFLLLDQPPTIPEDRGVPFFGSGTSIRLNWTTTMLRQSIDLAPEQIREALPVELRVGGERQSAELGQSGQQVLAGGQGGDVPGGPESSFGPAQEARNAMAAVVQADLLPPHAGIVNRYARRSAVVGQEDQDRILARRRARQHRIQLPEVLVDVRDHPEEAGNVSGQVAVKGAR